MSGLCAWVSGEPPEAAGRVVAAMGRALRVQAGQHWAAWSLPGLALGLLDLEAPEPPAVSADGRFSLWLAGEILAGGALLPGIDAISCRAPEVRRRLLDALLARGIGAARELDGEYWLALWDGRERTLALANDRFGALPLYWAAAGSGVALASGVRGVLAAGIPAEPDLEALREAVTFGGFRLGDRTNVAAVKMLPGATVAEIRESGARLARSFRWDEIPAQPQRSFPELTETAHRLWQEAIGRRLAGATRPGQTLSGGLDSRAILAEAAPRSSRWTAVTFGVPGCDDARYAERAAVAAGARWLFSPLYGPAWLERRTALVQETDGLIQLGDLQHLESLGLQREHLDLHLSGYIGDAVAGATFGEVAGPERILAALPYYGGALGLPYEEALERARRIETGLAGAPARFALFEHKLPQSTNRWTAAYRPYFRVRRPFTDYAFFDFFQGLPTAARGEDRLYERWLAASYPAFFARIPNQKTGLPVLAPPWRLHLERARRFAWRKLQPALAAAGLPARPRIRAFTADDTAWTTPEARAAIEGAVLRPGSLAVEVFGREAVAGVLSDWFTRGAAPAQMIGALYVYEVYHRDLGAFLAGRRREEGGA